MKTLFKVSCSGKGVNVSTFSDIYVVAEDYKEASDKALPKMKELDYVRVDNFVSVIEMIADEEESNNKLLIL